MQTIAKTASLLTLVSLLAACGGGGGSSAAQADDSGATTTSPETVLPTTPQTPTEVTISGKITFDLVPHSTYSFGLDYSRTEISAARGILVEAVDDAGVIIGSFVTDDDGAYSITAPLNTQLSIRAKAQLQQSAGGIWDVSVVDNTRSDAGYALQGSLSSSGEQDTIRDLHAGSGWGGNSYTDTRAAGPFAILDPIYEGMKKFEQIDSDIIFPALTIGWSPLNSPAYGELSDGNIVTSHYNSNTGKIYILGKEDSDTDEYDRHVVVHEWAHYFEDKLSRSDSLGGSHNAADYLDPRVAMGEGFGNALAAMLIDDPIYKDTLSSKQASGFSLDVESNAPRILGWYSEASVQSLLYDFYDSSVDGIDRTTLGLAPIYESLTSDAYKNSAAFTTIYSFIDELKQRITPEETTQVETLLLAQGIIGTGKTGIGESTHGGIPSILPIYKTPQIDGASVEVCSNREKGTVNQLGNYAYAYITVPADGNYKVSAIKSTGLADSDPEIKIYSAGEAIAISQSNAVDIEVWSGELTEQDYTIEVYDYVNTTSNYGVDACYELSITRTL